MQTLGVYALSRLAKRSFYKNFIHKNKNLSSKLVKYYD